MIRECSWCREIFIAVVDDACPECKCPASTDLGKEFDAGLPTGKAETD